MSILIELEEIKGSLFTTVLNSKCAYNCILRVIKDSIIGLYVYYIVVIRINIY